jgi:xanthosine utilization system XapX-like protein
MDFSALGGFFAPLVAWFDTHPAALSWLLGWIAAISFGQAAKQFLPGWWDVTAAKRFVQAFATGVGFIVAYLLWPLPAPPAVDHRVVFAILCGMSAPTAYTIIKAVIETRFPDFAYKLSWSRVQDRKLNDCATRECVHPECPNKEKV